MGLLDDFLGGGDPNAMNQTYGVPQGVVNNANSNSLLSLGGLLMAAGQRMTPMQRAQYLSQIGSVANERDNSLYKGAQSYLMGRKANAELAELAKPGKAGVHVVGGALVDDSGNVLYQQPQTQPQRAMPTPQMVDLPGGGKGWATPGSTDVVPITGAGKGTSEEPKKTEGEAKGYQFAQQTIDAYKKLADPEYQYALRSRTQQLANKIPFFNTPWSSNDYLAADAASSAMTDAILRNKSGATIHDPEIQDEIRRVIPRPGDTDKDITDKIARQRQMIEGFIGQANPADRKALREMFDNANQGLMKKYQGGGAASNSPAYGSSSVSSRPIIQGQNGHRLQLSADGKRWEDIGR